MATLRLTIEIPGWTADDLRRAVRAIDVLESNEDDAIAYEYIKASHVVELILSGALGIMDSRFSAAFPEGTSTLTYTVDEME